MLTELECGMTVLMDWKFGLGRKPYPEGAMPGDDLPMGMPEGYAQGSEEAVENEGWRKTQKGRLIDKMQSKYPGDSFNETLAGSKYLDDSMRRSKNPKALKQMADEAALVAMLDAHEAKQKAAAGTDGQEEGGEGAAAQVTETANSMSSSQGKIEIVEPDVYERLSKERGPVAMGVSVVAALLLIVCPYMMMNAAKNKEGKGK